MYKTLIKVFLGVILIIIVAYFLDSRANTPEACANIEGLWNPADEVCETPTEKVIYQSLSKPNPVSVNYPKTLTPDTSPSESGALSTTNTRLVQLNHLEKIDEFVYLRGNYEPLLQAADGDKAAIYDRGTVYLNMSKLALLTTDTSGFTYFAAPFVINTAGSGVFVYAGLFSYNFATHQAEHLSSALLGNRIRDEILIVEDKSIVQEGIFIQDGLLNIKFKSHGLEQAFSEYPTQSSEVLLQLVGLDPANNTKAMFRRINDATPSEHKTKSLTMHPSWDANNDGVNDCEQDGSCDHSVDYTIARIEVAPVFKPELTSELKDE